MTPLQFKRWSDFATRMALSAWPDATYQRKRKLVAAIEDFLCDAEPYKAETEDWDGNDMEKYCVGDELMDYCDNAGYSSIDPNRQNKFENQIHCCIRAGLDVAVKPSAGVVGFDIAMLERMWFGRIPGWVRVFFDPPLFFGYQSTDKVWL